MNRTKKEEKGEEEEGETVRITENDLPQEFVLKLLGRHEARGLWGIKHTREPVDFMVRYAKSRKLSLPIVQLVITKEGVFVSPIICKLDNSIGKMATASDGKSSADLKSEKTLADHRLPETKAETGKTIAANPSIAVSSYLNAMKNDPAGSVAGKTGKTREKFNFCRGGKQEEKKMSKPATTDLRLLEKLSKFDWEKTGIFFFGIDTISYGVQDLIFTRVFSMIVVLDRRTRKMTGANSSFSCHAFVCESRSTAKRVTHALAAAFQAYGRSMKFLREIQCPKKTIREEKPKKFAIELRPPSEIAFDQSEA